MRFSSNHDAVLAAFYPELCSHTRTIHLEIPSAFHPEIEACNNHKIDLGLWLKEGKWKKNWN
jgi:hypothetical protein